MPALKDGPMQRQPSKAAEAFPPLLKAFCVAATLLEAVCLLTEFVCTHLLGLRRLPYSGYALPGSSNYIDLLMFFPRFKDFHSDAFFRTDTFSHFLYPPAAATVYQALYALGGAHCLRLFFLLFLTSCGLAIVLLFRAMRRRGAPAGASMLFLLICTICSFPLYFEFNRANIELFVTAIAALGLLAFLRDRPWLAGVLFGMAGAIKLYPLIYLGLLLPRRQIRQLLCGISTFFLVSLASLWGTTPNLVVAWRGIQSGLAEFGSVYVLHRRYGEIGFDHSLIGLVKRSASHLPPPLLFGREVSIYLLIMALTGLALYMVLIRKLPVVNQVLCLTIACILLPPTSYDYTLLHLYLPWSMLVLLVVDAWRESRVQTRGLRLMFACFVVLLGPELEFIYHGERFGGQIKAVTLLLLFVLALRFRLPSGFDRRDILAESMP